MLNMKRSFQSVEVWDSMDDRCLWNGVADGFRGFLCLGPTTFSLVGLIELFFRT